MSVTPTDEDAVEALVAEHGMAWVVDQLDAPEVWSYLCDRYPVPEDIAGSIDVLQEAGYPAEIIELLKDNCLQPWLAPAPRG